MSWWSSWFGGETKPAPAAPKPVARTPGKAPAFQQNKPFNQGQQSCPLKKVKPCDVQKLIVKDDKTSRKLQTTKKLVLEKVPPGTPKWLIEPLGRYDLVLELIADYQTSSADPIEKDILLHVQSYFTGNCQCGQHPLVKMEPIRGADRSEAHEWKNSMPPAQKYLARSYFLDSHFEGFFLAPFWSFDSVKQIVVSANSCGIRPGGQGMPNATLTCLVNIYRNDVYSLTLKIPSFKTLSKSRSATANWKGDVVKKSDSSTSTWGRTTSESSTTRTTNGSAHTDHTKTTVGGKTASGQYTVLSETVGTKGGQVFLEESEKTTQRSSGIVRGGRTSTRSDSTEKGKKETLLERDPPEIVPVISFKRNGQELNFTEFVNNILGLYKTLKDAWEELQGWVPEIGWSAKFSLDLFEGSIEGKWGNKYAEAPPPSPRYLAIRSFYEINLAITIFNLKLEVAFGVNIQSPGVLDKLLTVKAWELILQAKGTITSKASISKAIKSSESPTWAKITSDNSIDLMVQARATVAGITADARAGVTGGIAFEGELHCSFKESLHIEGTFKMKKLTLYAQYTNPITGRSGKAEKNVFEEKVLWKGNLPGGKPAPKAKKK
ncbi:Hypothetical protein A7982_11955 [Minicystis rosea]|nr:Hypothetical protein A7982_11955 [Minicystis rosea]